MKSSLLFYALLCPLVLLLSVSGASAARISGTVTDAEGGEALPYVSVILIGVTANGDTLRDGQAADETGRFVFRGLPAGTYKLKLLYIGYETLTQDVTVGEFDAPELSLAMGVKPFEVDQIVVEADRFKAERDVQTGFVALGNDVIARTPGIVESDPLRTLQLLPGVQAASDVSSGLYIRGGGPDQTLVLLDDVPVYNPTHALGFFSTFNADAVGDVALYKGAYPAEHTGRLGSVLDVQSRMPAAPKLRGTGGISTIAARLTIEGPVGKNHWLVSGRRTYLDPILAAARSPENPLPSYYFYDLNARFVTPRDNDWWTFNAYRGRDVIGFNLDETGDINVDWGNTVVSAAYNRTFGSALTGKVQLSGSEYGSVTNATVFGTSFGIDNRLRDATLRTDFDYRGFSTHRIRLGLSGAAYDFKYNQTFNQSDGVQFGTKPYEVSGYVDDTWKPVDPTTIRVGLRDRWLSDGDRYLFEPRLSVAQALNPQWRLKAGGGIYHQYVQLVSTEGFSFGDFYVPIDETTDPGRSWQTVLGAEWTPTSRYRFSLEGYYTGLENLVALDNTTPEDQKTFTAEDLFYTGGTGYASGIELFLERRIGNVTGWLGYTLGWTRRTFAEVNQGGEYAPKYDRRHDINFVASYQRGKWRYGTTFVYGTGQAFTPASARYGLRDPATGLFPDGGRVLAASKNSARLLPYHRLDVSVSRSFRNFGVSGEWFVQVFNFYNRRNEWFVQYGEEDGLVNVDVVKMLPIIPSIGVNFTF